jgi:hypothetical protein
VHTTSDVFPLKLIQWRYCTYIRKKARLVVYRVLPPAVEHVCERNVGRHVYVQMPRIHEGANVVVVGVTFKIQDMIFCHLFYVEEVVLNR